jgi:hypothetical protein
VHKGIGLTTDLFYDMWKTFAPGQGYTAISRATTLEGLTLKNFDVSLFICSQVAKEFYESIPPIVLTQTLANEPDAKRPIVPAKIVDNVPSTITAVSTLIDRRHVSSTIVPPSASAIILSIEVQIRESKMQIPIRRYNKLLYLRA